MSTYTNLATEDFYISGDVNGFQLDWERLSKLKDLELNDDSSFKEVKVSADGSNFAVTIAPNGSATESFTVTLPPSKPSDGDLLQSTRESPRLWGNGSIGFAFGLVFPVVSWFWFVRN